MCSNVTLQSPWNMYENFYNSLVLGKWQHVKETTEIGEGKLFSPGNLRATFDNPDYEKVHFSTQFYSIEKTFISNHPHGTVLYLSSNFFVCHMHSSSTTT